MAMQSELGAICSSGRYALADAILRHHRGASDAPGVLIDGAWRSRSETADAAGEVDRLLDSAGVARTLAVGLVLHNRPLGFAALTGLIAARRTVALINPFQAVDRIANDIAMLKVAAVVIDVADHHDETAEACRLAGAAVITLDETARVMRLVVGMRPPGEEGTVHLSLPDTAVQMLTSGTTGPPKRIPLPWFGLGQAIRDQAWMSALMGEAPPSDAPESTLVQYGPMVQLSGLFNALQAASEGRRLVLMEKFTPSIWIDSVREHRQTMLGLPPTMLRMILEANPDPADLASLRSVRSGAAPLDAHTRTAFEHRYDCPILSIYGATEFIGPLCSWTLEDHARLAVAKEGSVGRIWPGMANARTVDADSGALLATGETGLLELQVHRSGADWIRTNDLARIDEDGFLYLLGRADDAINRGGFKILPNVVADALRGHEAVYDVAVVPLPDARLGQIPGAVIELRSGYDHVDIDALVDFARANLVAYQVPAKWIIEPELPRTAAGKINRPAVAALFDDAR